MLGMFTNDIQLKRESFLFLFGFPSWVLDDTLEPHTCTGTVPFPFVVFSLFFNFFEVSSTFPLLPPAPKNIPHLVHPPRPPTNHGSGVVV